MVSTFIYITKIYPKTLLFCGSLHLFVVLLLMTDILFLLLRFVGDGPSEEAGKETDHSIGAESSTTSTALPGIHENRYQQQSDVGYPCSSYNYNNKLPVNHDVKKISKVTSEMYHSLQNLEKDTAIEKKSSSGNGAHAMRFEAPRRYTKSIPASEKYQFERSAAPVTQPLRNFPYQRPITEKSRPLERENYRKTSFKSAHLPILNLRCLNTQNAMTWMT